MREDTVANGRRQALVGLSVRYGGIYGIYTAEGHRPTTDLPLVSQANGRPAVLCASVAPSQTPTRYFAGISPTTIGSAPGPPMGSASYQRWEWVEFIRGLWLIDLHICCESTLFTSK